MIRLRLWAPDREHQGTPLPFAGILKAWSESWFHCSSERCVQAEYPHHPTGDTQPH
uniref:Uncharacterized protein n=1 Tax=Anguilla anguilla TaxID=7936 RepID=A0A0E9PI40_ANGAN